MPADFPPWPTVYYYFTKWTADGRWARVSGCLTVEVWEREKKRAAYGRRSRQPKRENTATSTARVGFDAGKRTKGRKRFFLVDTAGNLLATCVVAASRLPPRWPRPLVCGTRWHWQRVARPAANRLRGWRLWSALPRAPGPPGPASAGARAWWPTRAAFSSAPQPGSTWPTSADSHD